MLAAFVFRSGQMGTYRLNSRHPWLSNTDGAQCLFCNDSIEYIIRFFYDYSEFKNNFESVWASVNQKLMSPKPIDRAQISNFINRHQKDCLLQGGGLQLPFDQATATLTTRVLSTAR